MSGLLTRLQRITSNKAYYPEIDGIRFVAIMLVVLFHAFGYFSQKTAPMLGAGGATEYPLLTQLLQNGDRGVELFFVLSGFILCLPFARHYIQGKPAVELKKYYLRRVTRLEPPYILAMTGLLVLNLLMHTHPAHVLVPSWLASLVYSHGLIYEHTPLLTVVAWSLEIEIQFYVVAPLLFATLKLPVAVRRSVLVGAIGAMVVLQNMYPAREGFLSLYGFVQYFLAGILLADLYVCRTKEAAMQHKGMIVAGLAALIAVVYLPLGHSNESATIVPAVTYKLIFPFLILLFYYTVLMNGVVKKMFSVPFLAVTGGMCYSVYLLHYTVISAVGRYTQQLRITDGYLLNLAVQLVLLTVPAMLVSAVFYYYIERPFMDSKWTDKLMGKKTTTKQ